MAFLEEEEDDDVIELDPVEVTIPPGGYDSVDPKIDEMEDERRRIKAADFIERAAPEVQREAVRRIQTPSFEDRQDQRIMERAESLSSPPSDENKIKSGRETRGSLEDLEQKALTENSYRNIGRGFASALSTLGSGLMQMGGISGARPSYSYTPEDARADREGILSRFAGRRRAEVEGKREEATQAQRAAQQAAEFAAQQERSNQELELRRAGEARLRTATEARTAREGDEASRETAAATTGSPESMSAAELVIATADRNGEPLTDAQQQTVRGASASTLAQFQRLLDSGTNGRRRRHGGGGGGGRGGSPLSVVDVIPQTEEELQADRIYRLALTQNRRINIPAEEAESRARVTATDPDSRRIFAETNVSRPSAGAVNEGLRRGGGPLPGYHYREGAATLNATEATALRNYDTDRREFRRLARAVTTPEMTAVARLLAQDLPVSPEQQSLVADYRALFNTYATVYNRLYGVMQAWDIAQAQQAVPPPRSIRDFASQGGVIRRTADNIDGAFRTRLDVSNLEVDDDVRFRLTEAGGRTVERAVPAPEANGFESRARRRGLTIERLGE